MAIFTKTRKSDTDNTNTTIVSYGTTVTGEIHGDCRLHVDGDLSGTVTSKSVVSVGKTGYIIGDVVSEKLVIYGRFSGIAYCEEIEIKTGGEVIGQITSSILVIERGGFFEGESKRKTSAEHPVRRPGDDGSVVSMKRKIKAA